MVTKSQTGRGWYEASRGSNNQRRFLKDDKDGKDKNSAALLAIRASPLDSAHQTDVTIRQSHDRIRQWKPNGNSCSEIKPAAPKTQSLGKALTALTIRLSGVFTPCVSSSLPCSCAVTKNKEAG